MPTYQLLYKINKFDNEVLGTYFVPALAYGMRKKFLKEQPEKFKGNKLFVKKLK